MDLILILFVGLFVAGLGLLLWSCLAMAGVADHRMDQCREK
jgi:hypothetical protein